MAKQINSIQEIRAIAVLAVITFHIFPNEFRYGYLGVDIFFVVSGYVITPRIVRIFEKSQQREITKIIFYFRKRFWRIFPSLVGVQIFIFIFIFPLYSIRFLDKLFIQANLGTLGLGNLGAFRYEQTSDYFAVQGSPVVHLWSLGVEAQIYLFLPLFFLVLNKVSSKVRYFEFMLLLSIGSFTISIDPILYDIFLENDNYTNQAQLSFYSPISRFWEFGIGALVSLIRKNPKTVRVFGFSLVMFATLFIYVSNPIKTSVYVCSVTAILILLFEEKNIFSSQLRIVSAIGDRSYSLYLFHLPIIWVFERVAGLGFNLLVSQIVCAVSIFLISELNYRLIEKRFRL